MTVPLPSHCVHTLVCSCYFDWDTNTLKSQALKQTEIAGTEVQEVLSSVSEVFDVNQFITATNGMALADAEDPGASHAGTNA